MVVACGDMVLYGAFRECGQSQLFSLGAAWDTRAFSGDIDYGFRRESACFVATVSCANVLHASCADGGILVVQRDREWRGIKVVRDTSFGDDAFGRWAGDVSGSDQYIDRR